MPLNSCRECGSPVSRRASSCPACGHPTPGASIANLAGVVLTVALIGGVWLWLDSVFTCESEDIVAPPDESTEPIPTERVTPPEDELLPRTEGAAFREDLKPPDLAAVTSLMGKKRRDVERILGKPVDSPVRRRACRVTCPRGRPNDIYFRCKSVEYAVDYKGYRFDLAYRGGRLTFAQLSLDRLPPELENESLASRALGITLTHAPVGVPSVSLAWRACNGNSTVRDSRGAPLDFTFYRNSRGGGLVDLTNNYTVPKRLRELSFDQAMRLMQ